MSSDIQGRKPFSTQRCRTKRVALPLIEAQR